MLMLIYLIPPIAVVLAWSVWAGSRFGRLKLWDRSSKIWTISAGAALIGSLLGLLWASLSVHQFIEYFFGGELIGCLVGGGVGAAVGQGATSVGRWSGPLVGLAYSVLYWLFALITSLAWLLINNLGDCFDDKSCIHHRQQAFPQTIYLLLFYLVLYAILQAVSALRGRKPHQ